MISAKTASRFLASVASATSTLHGRMSAWQLNSYDSPSGLIFNSSVRVPTIDRPGDVLIEVHAASVNPIDVQMTNGFGRTIIGALRQIDHRSTMPVSEFPLTLGRDCSGVVVETGRSVHRLKPGDQVWCAIPASRQGTFGQYVAVNSCSVAKKPKNLTHVEAASLPYVACTVWSALRYAARMNPENSAGSNVLVFGGAGGIGTLAVQLLNAWGANVTATCRPDAFDMVKKLGAINVVDYTAADAWDQLTQSAPYDVILDPIFDSFSRRSPDLLKFWRGSTYVSITNPLLDDCDQRGLSLGLLTSAKEFSKEFWQCLQNGRIYTWAYVMPDFRVLTELTRLVESDKIRPVVEKVFRFGDLPSAFEKVAKGRARGKVVVEVRSERG